MIYEYLEVVHESLRIWKLCFHTKQKMWFYGFSDHLICWQSSMDSLPDAKGSFSPAVWTPSFHMNFTVIANHRFLGTGEESSFSKTQRVT